MPPWAEIDGAALALGVLQAKAEDSLTAEELELEDTVSDGCDMELLRSRPPLPLSSESGADGVRTKSREGTAGPCKSMVEEGDVKLFGSNSTKTVLPPPQGGVAAEDWPGV